MDSHWNQYTSAVGNAPLPESSNPRPIVKYAATDQKTFTGFYDLVPQYPEDQAKYDAMSPNWKKEVEPRDPEVLNRLFGAPISSKK